MTVRYLLDAIAEIEISIDEVGDSRRSNNSETQSSCSRSADVPSSASPTNNILHHTERRWQEKMANLKEEKAHWIKESHLLLSSIPNSHFLEIGTDREAVYDKACPDCWQRGFVLIPGDCVCGPNSRHCICIASDEIGRNVPPSTASLGVARWLRVERQSSSLRAILLLDGKLGPGGSFEACRILRWAISDWLTAYFQEAIRGYQEPDDDGVKRTKWFKEYKGRGKQALAAFEASFGYLSQEEREATLTLAQDISARSEWLMEIYKSVGGAAVEKAVREMWNQKRRILIAMYVNMRCCHLVRSRAGLRRNEAWNALGVIHWKYEIVSKQTAIRTWLAMKRDSERVTLQANFEAQRVKINKRLTKVIAELEASTIQFAEKKVVLAQTISVKQIQQDKDSLCAHAKQEIRERTGLRFFSLGFRMLHIIFGRRCLVRAVRAVHRFKENATHGQVGAWA